MRLALRGNRGHRITVLSLHLRQNGDRERERDRHTEQENGRNIANLVKVENCLVFPHCLVETEKGVNTIFGRAFYIYT